MNIEGIELDEKESEAYKVLLLSNDIEKIFKYGYIIGRAKLSEEMLQKMKTWV